MANLEHWVFKDEAEMWTKLIGESRESEEKNRATAGRLFFEKGVTALEIGAGVGRLMRYALEEYEYVYGVDWSAMMVAASTQYLQYRPRARVIWNDGYKIPFTDGKFDLIYSFTCFQHMPTLEMILANFREAFRVLDDDGCFRFQTVIGKRDSGLHDGYVFESITELDGQLRNCGFTDSLYMEDGAWVWVKTRKS